MLKYYTHFTSMLKYISLEEVHPMENEEELSAEELQELMSCYKKELAHIYRTASAKRAAAMKRDTVHRNTLLRQCDEEMRSDIDSLKKKFGIHY